MGPGSRNRLDAVGLLILAFAAIDIALGAWALIDPGSFFRHVGPFGTSNAHYTRDAGTFQLSLGVALAIAYFRPRWRVGAVGYAFLQYAFHALNHLADIDKAHPHRAGPLDFVSLAIGAAVLAWLLAKVLRERGVVEP